eukprot:2804811-Amphidinium_carterae.1
MHQNAFEEVKEEILWMTHRLVQSSSTFESVYRSSWNLLLFFSAVLVVGSAFSRDLSAAAFIPNERSGSCSTMLCCPVEGWPTPTSAGNRKRRRSSGFFFRSCLTPSVMEVNPPLPTSPAVALLWHELSSNT